MSGFRILPTAEAELDDIWLYVARESGSIDIANRLIDSLTERFFLLALHPQLGRRRDHDLRPGLRSFPVGEYVIVYRIEPEEILILHVMRGSRDIAGLMQD
ncbi:MAG TPA: type II toxin-antitoxin system RelE/ParE family toxin [Bryobacteraceae bacterium]|jgi:toxin ParE1/3/4|nr:type II toxin-antitoxin system RelE/ParE family toxin [Bryobacteraceae bacterium]